MVSHLSNMPTLQSVTVGVSIGVVFTQFCGIVLYAVIMSIRNRCKEGGYCNGNNDQLEDNTDDFIDECDRDFVEDDVVNGDEVQPLLGI